MSYEAVFIDWDGTLSNSRFWERWRDDPVDRVKYAKIQTTLFESAAGKSLIKSWMTGAYYENVLKELSEMTDLPRGELEDELQYSAENMKFTDEGVLKSIYRLREMGTLAVIATDNMDTFKLWTVPSLDLNEHFDHVLSSSSLKYLKSTAMLNGKSWFFHHYLNSMGILPEKTVLIDNSPCPPCVKETGINFRLVTDEQPLSYHLDEILDTSS